MMTPDLRGLRRFSLVVGVLVITWALAGITFDPEATVAPLGIPFRIVRPELLPVGLFLTSVYATVRYYYYGFMLGTSPYRKRRDTLDALRPDRDPTIERGKGKVRMYAGPTAFETTPWHWDQKEVEAKAAELVSAFPKFARARVTTEVKWSQGVDDDGDVYSTYAVAAEIPIRCRVGALIEDVDYSMPVWLNVAAMIAMIWHWA